MNRTTVYELIDRERSLQDTKYPLNSPTSGEFLLLLQRKINQLGEEWYYDADSVNKRFLQIAALAVAHIETIDAALIQPQQTWGFDAEDMQ